MRINGIEHERVGFSYNGLWSELKLDDGTVLRVKLEVTAVLRVSGGYNEYGEPLYAVNGQTIVLTASTPKELMRPDVEPLISAEITPETVEEFGRKMTAIVKGKAN